MRKIQEKTASTERVGGFTVQQQRALKRESSLHNRSGHARWGC
ncbi:hypothetical protein CLU85_2486 [Acidovorax sp. 69]|nr:hypothetical protein CLU85_2486 [Acidovorax sp. 69]